MGHPKRHACKVDGCDNDHRLTDAEAALDLVHDISYSEFEYKIKDDLIEAFKFGCRHKESQILDLLRGKEAVQAHIIREDKDGEPPFPAQVIADWLEARLKFKVGE